MPDRPESRALCDDDGRYCGLRERRAADRAGADQLLLGPLLEGWRRRDQPPPPFEEGAAMATDTRSRPTSTFSPDLLLPVLFRAHPEARAIFDRHGLHGCGGRDGPYESIRTFARAHGSTRPGCWSSWDAPSPPRPPNHSSRLPTSLGSKLRSTAATSSARSRWR